MFRELGGEAFNRNPIFLPLVYPNIKHIKKGALVFEKAFSLRCQKNMYKFLWGVVSYLYERNIVLVISTWLT